MGDTSIEYVDCTVNPIRARWIGSVALRRHLRGIGHYCEKVSAGCAKCYSSAHQPRFGLPTFDKQRLGENVEVYFEPSVLDECLRRRKPTRYFPFDMTDAWGAWVKDEWLDYFFAVAAQTPQHTYLFPTKRPERMRAYSSSLAGLSRRERGIRMVRSMYRGHPAEGLVSGIGTDTQTGGMDWPLPNVHLGVSVEDQATADERIPLLLQTPAAVRWVSLEPQLTPVDLGIGRWIRLPHTVRSELPFANLGATPGVYRAESNPNGALSVHSTGHTLLGVKPDEFERLPSLNWVVTGGESGPGARPFDLAWARSTIAQCRATGVPVFVKQLGSVPIGNAALYEATWPAHVRLAWSGDGMATYRVRLRDRKGGDITEFPEDLRVREFPHPPTEGA